MNGFDNVISLLFVIQLLTGILLIVYRGLLIGIFFIMIGFYPLFCDSMKGEWVSEWERVRERVILFLSLIYY
jgi:hypothetical protein